MREFRGAFHVQRTIGIRRRQLDQAGSEFP